MKIDSTSCSLTQEVSQDLDKASVVFKELNQLFAYHYAFQSGLSAFEIYYWMLLLRPY